MLRREVGMLEHDLEIWELTHCAESRQSVMKAVAAIADTLDRIVSDVAAREPAPEPMQTPVMSTAAS
jgi:hypothetical protein